MHMEQVAVQLEVPIEKLKNNHQKSMISLHHLYMYLLLQCCSNTHTPLEKSTVAMVLHYTRQRDKMMSMSCMQFPVPLSEFAVSSFVHVLLFSSSQLPSHTFPLPWPGTSELAAGQVALLRLV